MNNCSLLLVKSMTCSLMILEGVNIFVQFLTEVTCEHFSHLAVRVLDMPSTIPLATELFSALGTCKPALSFQNLAPISCIEDD